MPGCASSTRQTPDASTATSVAATAGPQVSDPAPRATYDEWAPHVASSLIFYGVQGGVQGTGQAPPSNEPPVPGSAFRQPVATYLAYSDRQLGPMLRRVQALQTALQEDSRPAAKEAWQGAFADYLRLGAVYLEGKIGALDQAIDGNAGGLAGGTSSPQFSGLHRLEFGLWTGASLASLEPWADKLATDVTKLRGVLPNVHISPLDYATRAHEILEDAVRDLLSGTDVPWSGQGVVGTRSGVVATTEVVKTLAPLLSSRENVLPVVRQDMGELRATIASIAAAHGGSLPSNGELTQPQAEQLDASIGQALEALAQIPGALETAPTPQVPAIPKSAIQIVP